MWVGVRLARNSFIRFGRIAECRSVVRGRELRQLDQGEYGLRVYRQGDSHAANLPLARLKEFVSCLRLR